MASRVRTFQTDPADRRTKTASRLSPADLFDAYRRLNTPVWVYDTDRCRIAFANEAACRIWDADTEGKLRKRDLGKDMSTTVRERLQQYQASFVAHDSRFSEFWTLFPKGKPVHMEAVYSGFILDGDRMGMLVEAMSAEQDEVPDTIRSAEALLHTDVMITLFGANGSVLYSNPSSGRTMLVDDENALQTRLGSTEVYEELVSELANARECARVLEVNTKQGKRWHNLSIKSCLDAVTGNDAYLVTEIDVGEMKAAQDRASYLAHHDPLTGLYNRSFVQNYIENPKVFQRDQANLTAIFYLDIDRFKSINDRQGHEFGDTVLMTVADRIRDSVKASDAVSRLGGDEFVVLINGAAGNLDKIAERIRKNVSKPIDCGDTKLTVSCSIGIARYPEDGDRFDTLMHNADLALYAAKNAGREAHCHFSASMQEEVQKRLQLEQDLVRALASDQFVLHYQPRVEVATNRIVGAEALVRWQHPDRGLVPPGEFIPVCEETGLIEELGELVLTLAARQQAAWAKRGHRIRVSANLSPRQFQSARLMPLMQDITRYPGLDPSLLEFEITESMLMGDNEQILATLKGIRQLGFCVALDDFGTGYSNLAYIPRYPIGCIKIDKSFVDQLPHSSPVIGLILSLGRQVGAKVVAEGVETDPQLQQLRVWGCDEFQGYLFQRPQPVDIITDMLDRQPADIRASAEDILPIAADPVRSSAKA
ncbi:MAG: EAL domain-containing protein [Pseudomonadota bacterium]